MTVLAAGWLEGLWQKAVGDPWQILALVAQAVFAARFLAQWIASERAKRVVVPPIFWWLSIAGSAGLFVYFAIKQEPVLLVAQVLQVAIYARNLVLHHGAAPPGAAAA